MLLKEKRRPTVDHPEEIDSNEQLQITDSEELKPYFPNE